MPFIWVNAVVERGACVLLRQDQYELPNVDAVFSAQFVICPPMYPAPLFSDISAGFQPHSMVLFDIRFPSHRLRNWPVRFRPPMR